MPVVQKPYCEHEGKIHSQDGRVKGKKKTISPLLLWNHYISPRLPTHASYFVGKHKSLFHQSACGGSITNVF